MSEQPEALRLADVLEDIFIPVIVDRQQAAAELRRLHQHELAHIKWLEKTEWVQDTAHYSELGEHRADVIKQRFDRLHEVNQELLEALKHARTLVDEWGNCASQYEQERYGLQSDLLMLDAAIAKGEQA